MRRNKAINLSLAPDLWEWIQKKADNNGLRIPTSRVIAHLLSQVIEKERLTNFTGESVSQAKH